jgi:predicted nucleic acid-binding protein
MTILADTNVISELAKKTPNAGVVAWASSIQHIALSVVTIEEVAYGLAWRPNPRVAAWWRKFVRKHVEVFVVTAAVAGRAGGLRGRLAAAGVARSQADMIIAATAAEHGLTLVTRNTRDFDGSGVTVLNPFTP